MISIKTQFNLYVEYLTIVTILFFHEILAFWHFLERPKSMGWLGVIAQLIIQLLHNFMIFTVVAS